MASLTRHVTSRCTLEGLPNKVLAAEYHAALPDEKLLAEELERTRRMLEGRTAALSGKERGNTWLISGITGSHADYPERLNFALICNEGCLGTGSGKKIMGCRTLDGGEGHDIVQAISRSYSAWALIYGTSVTMVPPWMMHLRQPALIRQPVI